MRAVLLDALGTLLRLEDPVAPLRRELAARDYLRGRRIRAGETAGVAAGVDPAGRLQVETAAGPVYVESGEIVLD